MVDTIERADLDGDVIANPPLWAELFFRPELEDDGDDDEPDTDGGPRDAVDGSRNSLDDVAEPSFGATVTITDALPQPPPFLRGIRGILSGWSSAMALCGGPRARISPTCHRENGIGRRVNQGYPPQPAGAERMTDVERRSGTADGRSGTRGGTETTRPCGGAMCASFTARRRRRRRFVAPGSRISPTSSVTTATGANGNRCTQRAIPHIRYCAVEGHTYFITSLIRPFRYRREDFRYFTYSPIV